MTKEEERVRALLKRFFVDVDRGVWGDKECRVLGDDVFISTWRYIKWIAEKNIPVSDRFIDELPLLLMELYMEFRSTDATLRTASRSDRRYHQSYYLKSAQELLNRTPPHTLSPVDVYKHPAMLRVQNELRNMKGRYKKRTLLLWISKLVKRSPGRPKKHSNLIMPHMA